MRFPFESEEAQQLNRDIFEAIYYGAMKASCELAQINGPYETYQGSPVSKGVSKPIPLHTRRIGAGTVDLPIRHVERHAIEPLELDGTSQSRRSIRCSQ